ncbi:hypothetical protein T261_8250 [Streptomyces lydicus]|nr:hypothetical protein T261_8250 [Streptomyces lydicus]
MIERHGSGHVTGWRAYLETVSLSASSSVVADSGWSLGCCLCAAL